MDQKWPVIFLDTQFRMYDILYYHLVEVIYAGELKRQRLDTIKQIAFPS